MTSGPKSITVLLAEDHNVMRHGLGSGERELVDAIVPTVRIERLD